MIKKIEARCERLWSVDYGPDGSASEVAGEFSPHWIEGEIKVNEAMSRVISIEFDLGFKIMLTFGVEGWRRAPKARPH